MRPRCRCGAFPVRLRASTAIAQTSTPSTRNPSDIYGFRGGPSYRAATREDLPTCVFCTETIGATPARIEVTKAECERLGLKWQGRDNGTSFAWKRQREHEFYQQLRLWLPITALIAIALGFLLVAKREAIADGIANGFISVLAGIVRRKRSLASARGHQAHRSDVSCAVEPAGIRDRGRHLPRRPERVQRRLKSVISFQKSPPSVLFPLQ